MMKKALVAVTVLVLAVVGSVVAWQLLDDDRRGGALVLRGTNVLTSPSGDFSLAVEDTGITMKGPNSSVELTPGGLLMKSNGSLSIQGSATVSVQGAITNLGCSSGGRPIARVGDMVGVTGPSPSPILPPGSPTVLAC